MTHEELDIDHFIITAKSKIYEASHYAVFPTLPSFHPFSTQIFASALSVHVPSIMTETKFHTHTEP
jgi:hypothetical protein